MQNQPAPAEASIMSTLARQNDAIRQALQPIRFNGQLLDAKVALSFELSQLDHEDLLPVLKALREFDAYESGNDPYGEHDFTVFSHPVRGVEKRFMFKIEYFSDASMNFGSEDPVDPSKTFRLAMLSLVSEH